MLELLAAAVIHEDLMRRYKLGMDTRLNVVWLQANHTIRAPERNTRFNFRAFGIEPCG